MVSAETSAGCGPGLGPTPALPAPLASSWASPEASPALGLLPGFDQGFLREDRPFSASTGLSGVLRPRVACLNPGSLHPLPRSLPTWVQAELVLRSSGCANLDCLLDALDSTSQDSSLTNQTTSHGKVSVAERHMRLTPNSGQWPPGRPLGQVDWSTTLPGPGQGVWPEHPPGGGRPRGPLRTLLCAQRVVTGCGWDLGISFLQCPWVVVGAGLCLGMSHQGMHPCGCVVSG